MLNLAKSSEALLNEYKGNLFEFLVALEMSSLYNCTHDFYDSINSDFNTMLGQQEEFIRNYYPDLLGELPVMARELALKISKNLPQGIEQIELVGKSAANLKNIAEADILCRDNIQEYLISVKLSKQSAYVNTKSAGVKSFISKYFSDFPKASEFQNELSHFFDNRFEAFSRALHDSHDVEYDRDFSFWILEALPRLPGALKDEGRKLYLEFIYDVNNKIFEMLEQFHKDDEKIFKQSLLPLMGQSDSRIIQAISFYKGRSDNKQYKHHVFHLDNTHARIKLRNNKESTSFDIIMEDLILQIRLKCMNKFTSKSFKINCAVKH